MNQLFTPPPRTAAAACSAASIAPFASFFAPAAAGLPRRPPAGASTHPLSPGRHDVALGTFAKTVVPPALAPAPTGLPSPRVATGRASARTASTRTAGGRTVSGRARVATKARCADRSIVGVTRSGRATRSNVPFATGVTTSRSGLEKDAFPHTCAEAVGAMVAISVAPRTSENPRRTCEEAMETPLESGGDPSPALVVHDASVLHVPGQRREHENSQAKPQKSADPSVRGSARASRS